MSKTENNDNDGTTFPFESGDDVLVRVRENGTSGNIVAKFEAKCLALEEMPTGVEVARLSLPWGTTLTTATIRPYEAEFEVVE